MGGSVVHGGCGGEVVCCGCGAVMCVGGDDRMWCNRMRWLIAVVPCCCCLGPTVGCELRWEDCKPNKRTGIW